MMLRLALALLGLIVVGCSAQTGCNESQVDMFFIMDASSDVAGEDFGYMGMFVETFLNLVGIGPNAVKAGAAIITTQPRLFFDMLDDAFDLVLNLGALSALGGGRRIADAMTFVRTVGYRASEDRPAAPNVVVLIINGPETDRAMLEAEAELYRQNNIALIIILIGDKVERYDYESIALDRDHIITSFDFSELSSFPYVLKEMTSGAAKDICESTLPVTTVNGTWDQWESWDQCSRTCGGGMQSRSRICSSGSNTCTGESNQTQACNEDPCTPDCLTDYGDIYFLLDTSSEVEFPDFFLMVDFVSGFVQTLKIGPNASQVGLAVFSNQLINVFGLDAFKDKTSLLRRVQGTPYIPGERNTGDSLLDLVLAFAPNVDRPTAPNFVVLITNGPPKNSALAKENAAKIKQEIDNLNLIIIGVGGNVNSSEHEILASSPEMAWTVGSYQELGALQNPLRAVYAKEIAKTCNTSSPTVLPSATTCQMREVVLFGEVEYVQFDCRVPEVYPQAECLFYRKTQGGKPVPITGNILYSHIPASSGLTYLSVCDFQVTLKELGEGTHFFHAFAYPNVTAGMTLVNATQIDGNVTLSLPRATHYCPENLVEDYMCGKPVTCNCSITYAGRPRGISSWFLGGKREPPGPLSLTYDRRDDHSNYACVALSPLGQVTGSTLQFDIETTCD